jgi:hypothetical protein
MLTFSDYRHQSVDFSRARRRYRTTEAAKYYRHFVTEAAKYYRHFVRLPQHLTPSLLTPAGCD